MQDLFKIYRMMLAESAILHKKEGNLQLEAMFKNAQGKLRDILNLLFTVRSTTSLKRRSLFFTSSPNSRSLACEDVSFR